MFSYPFMQHAFISGGIIAIVCGIVSYFIILRRLAFATHALGHISLTGASGAVLLGVSALLGQVLVNIIAAIMMGIFGDKIRNNDIAVGVIFTFFLGLGMYFLFLFQTGYSGSVLKILVGNITSVSVVQIYMLIVIGIITLVILVFIARPLFLASLDPTIAEAMNIKVKVISVVFFVALALTVSLACQIVGILLVFSLLVGPGAIAVKWSDGFYTTIIVSIILALVTVWFSIFISYYIDVPISFLITSFICLFYIISALKNKFFG